MTTYKQTLLTKKAFKVQVIKSIFAIFASIGLICVVVALSNWSTFAIGLFSICMIFFSVILCGFVIAWIISAIHVNFSIASKNAEIFNRRFEEYVIDHNLNELHFFGLTEEQMFLAIKRCQYDDQETNINLYELCLRLEKMKSYKIELLLIEF